MLSRTPCFSTRGESNGHPFSYFVGTRTEGRGSAPGRFDHHRAGAWARSWSGHRNPFSRGSTRKSPSRKKSTADGAPRSYTTNRGLSDYAEVLPTGFCDALGKLGSSDRWLDIGAGEGQAILDYYAPQGDAAPEKCGGSGPKARAVAMSIEDRRTDRWQQQAASLGDRMRYLAGKRLSQYSRDELGKFQIITDVYGGFTYTENLSRFLEKVLSLLEMGGAFYTVLPGRALGGWHG